MSKRRPGLQGKWAYVINSLQEIIPSYEQASSRISFFADKRLRSEAVSFVVAPGALVLDLGAGPGTMSRLVAKGGGNPVLLDVSRPMLAASPNRNRVQGTFENLPFRDGAFDGVVSGFALRDAYDLRLAVSQLARVLRKGGRLGFCDLGKPDSIVPMVAVAVYLRAIPGLIGLVSTGRSGLRYGSIFDTYILVPHNSELAAMLSRVFDSVELQETQMGGSVVVKCVKSSVR